MSGEDAVLANSDSWTTEIDAKLQERKKSKFIIYKHMDSCYNSSESYEHGS